MASNSTFRPARIILPLLLAACGSTCLAQSPELQNAHSFKVEETLGHDAKITVEVIRPGKVRVELSNNHGMDGSYVCDGEKAYEYHQWSKTWQKLELAENGQYPSVLLDLGAVDLLLAGGKLAKGPNDRQTISKESLDGRETILTTNLGKAQTGRDGKPYQNEMKLWCDAQNGFPVRRVQGTVSGAGERIFQDLSFTDFKLNPQIEIAWKTPEGAKEDPGMPFLAAGSVAPDFTLKTAGGKEISLSDFRGKIVILDFWATWCGPCQRAMPHLQAIYKKLQYRGDVVVLGVCVWDEKDAYDQWVTQKKAIYTFPTAFDPAGKGKASIASKLFEVQAIPTQYVIDKDGKIVAGYIPGATKADPLVAALKKIGIEIGE